MNDTLEICPCCQSNACYRQTLSEELTTWLCFGCGKTTSTIMKKGSKVVEQARDRAPELHKDLMFVDENDLVWFPATISLPNQGMVFADGTQSGDWKWTAVQAVPLQEGDKKASKDQTHKMDMANAKQFAERDFMDALEHVGFFQEGIL